MILQGNQDLKNIYRLLHHYFNLKLFCAQFAGEVGDVIVSAILNADGFKNTL
jgi:hypothetical protein